MASHLEAVARRTIQIPYSSTVPPIYALNLNRFVAANPHDTNFIITKNGNYGTLSCLESNCSSFSYFLGSYESAMNSQVGAYGPLNYYAQHVTNDDAHVASRQARLNPNPSSSNGTPSPITSNLTSENSSLSQMRTVKPTPSRKRSSDCIELSDSETESPKAKRVKLDSPSKVPFGTVNSNVPTNTSPRTSSIAHATSTSSGAVSFAPNISLQNTVALPVPSTSTAASLTPSTVNPLHVHARPATSFPIAPTTASFGVPVTNPYPTASALLSTPSQQATNFNDFASSALDSLAADPTLDYDDFSSFQRQGHSSIPGRRYAGLDVRSFIEQYNQEDFGSDSSVKDGLQKLDLTQLGECLPGMTTSLLAHQVIGVAWMKSREAENARYCQGGILADAMGLGKTVQTIGLMCANPSGDPDCHATLIVAPLALLEQWKQEIMWKTEEDTFKVLIYHGPNRPKSKKKISKYDVVLTTYHTLANEWPDESKKKKKSKNAEQDFIIEDGEEEEKKKCGPLMDIHWYRVVLDEAQNIRNHRTRASSVVTHLIAEKRWCLTGTPLTNGLLDAFGLLRFIQHNPFADWDRFRLHIMRANETTGAQRLQHIFGPVMMRRNKQSTLEGRKIIELPPRNEDWVELTMSPEEREIYDFVEQKSQVRFNRFLQAGTVLKNYSQVLVMLMRLRQICVHPCLLKAYESAFEVTDTRAPEARKVVEDAANLVSNAFVALVKKNLRDAAIEHMKNEKLMGNEATVDDNCPICLEPFGIDAVVAAPCAHQFCRPCIQGHIARPRTEEDNQFKDHERDCPCCRQTISLNLLFERAPFEPTNEELELADDTLDSLEISWTVGEDGKGSYQAKFSKKKSRKSRFDDYSDLEDFIVDDDTVDQDKASYKSKDRVKRKTSHKPRVILSDDDTEDEVPKSKASKIKKPDEDDDEYLHSDDGDDEMDVLDQIRTAVSKYAERKQIKEAEDAIIDLDSDSEDNGEPKPSRTLIFDPVLQPQMMSSFMPSTKLQYMMRYIEEVARANPDEKTMVVSQWTSALDLCSDYLRERGISFVTYQGSMNARARTEAVNKFMTKSKVSVMLMSVKCGGVGLNLTRASRVISLDMSWNAATDQQCFDRAHRLGQQREVFIERLTIKDTVEQRMRLIQERKQGLSDAALGEGASSRVRLTIGELATLFGLGN
ncbi:related to DNA repair protein RAD16 [Serendipita indica DSM 11827]|uniref:Related to DNA repair protein RAD16 n=1 Tax=Serendipita indica (strain DSM 11827) TaxID=1109443 RepID=G4TMC9_SERID|nr:related to DNA repair protein RAD16 [Serendipita indica DSM 11827]